jgi:hypothetical protein
MVKSEIYRRGMALEAIENVDTIGNFCDWNVLLSPA